MIIRYLLFTSLCIYVFATTINAQVTPLHDNNWVIDRAKSDEFNNTIIDSSKWDVLDPSNGIGYNWGGGQFFRPDNALIDGTCLQLKVEAIPHSNKYYSGGIQSHHHDYSYGFFEIRAKLPGYYRGEKPCGKGFWPAFWTYYIEENDTCRVIHDEIDILEPSGSQYASAKSNVAGWHDEDTTCIKKHIKISGDIWYTNTEPLFLDFHKYAVEWLPDRIIFYFDEHPFYISYNHPKMIMNSQFVVIDQQIDGNTSLYPDTPLPQFMTIDYFRYYRLNVSHCGETASIQNNHQLNNFTQGVRKNIIIGDGTSSIYLSPGDKKTFRASNEIIINGSFEVPIGCELYLIPTQCLD